MEKTLSTSGRLPPECIILEHDQPSDMVKDKSKGQGLQDYFFALDFRTRTFLFCLSVFG